MHNLVDQLPPEQLAAIESLLSVMVDPVAHSTGGAPVDDESLTEDEAASLRRSEEWFRHNNGIPMSEVLADFGLSMKDFPLGKHGL